MEATDLITSLVSLEKKVATIGDQWTRDFVIEAQDCILRMQRENLELRRENHVLRLRQGTRREEPIRPVSTPTTPPPFIFHAIAAQGPSDTRDAGLRTLPPAKLPRAV